MDELEIMAYDPYHHLELLQSWWTARGAQVPDPELMAPTGYLVFMGGTPVVAAFLFRTDAKIAVISHVVSNPQKIDPDKRAACINLILAKLISRAREEGYKMVSASSNLPKLNARYEALGFVKTDEGEVHYGRAL